MATFFVDTTADDPAGICAPDNALGNINCSIRAAIAAAEATAGADTIDIADGTYVIDPVLGPFQLTSAEATTFIGNAAEPDQVVISGNDLVRVFDLSGGVGTPYSVSFQGMTIQNGVTNDGRGGGGINSGQDVDLTLTDVVMQNNVAGDALGLRGGALQANGNVVIDDSTIQNNMATRDGGGISFEPFGGIAKTLQITNSTISGNTTGDPGNDVGYGGGVFLRGADATATLDSVTVTGNSSGESGGGIYVQLGSISVTNSNFTNNDALGSQSGGGGLYVLGNGPASPAFSVTGGLFQENTAVAGAGGLESANAPGAVNGTTFNLNEVTGPGLTFNEGGGAISVLSTDPVNAPPVTITGATITNNTAPAAGGIAGTNANLTITGSTITDNNATGNLAGGGGVGAFSTTGTFPLTIDSTDILRNNAVAEAGGVGVLDVDLIITNSTIDNNIANGVRAGGVGALGQSRTPLVQITGTNVRNNQAVGDAGGIGIAGGSLQLDNVTVETNTSGGDGGGLGFAPTDATHTLSVTNTTSFSGNAATSRGNDVFVGAPATDAVFTNATVANGLFVEAGATVTLNTGASIAPITNAGTLIAAENVTIPGLLDNLATGTVRTFGSGTNTTVTVNDANNQGTIELTSDANEIASLNINNGPLINTGTIEILQGGGGGRQINGDVDNQGALNAIGINVNHIGGLDNSGTFRVGAGVNYLLSTNFMQTAGATTTFDVFGNAGSGTGQLAVTGQATLAGTLDLSIDPGATFVANDAFTPVAYGSATGQFGNITNTDVGGGLVLTPSYNADALVLTAITPAAGPASISVILFDDQSGDGTRFAPGPDNVLGTLDDVEDPPLGSIGRVLLEISDGVGGFNTVTDTSFTVGSGTTTLFDNLAAGDYRITAFANDAARVANTTQPVLLSVAAGQQFVPVASAIPPAGEVVNDSLAFGFALQSISATIFEDVTGDGTRFGPGPDNILGTGDDVEDPGLGNVGRLILEMDDGTGNFTEVADTGFTVGSGTTFTFDRLLPGDYRVSASSNDASAAPNTNQPILVTLAAGQEIVPIASDPQPIDELAVDALAFGFTRQSISATIFEDLNGDGTRFGPGPDNVLGTLDDVVDPGLGNVGRLILEMDDGTGNFSTVADTNFSVGSGTTFTFDRLLPGDYRVSALSNDASTAPNTIQPVLVTLAPGQEIVPIASDPQPIDELAVDALAFGFTRQSISATIFSDLNGDGTRFGPGPDNMLGTNDDVEDPGLGAIGRLLLEMDDGTGNFTSVADTGLTVGSGVTFTFDRLLPGDYRVTAFANDPGAAANTPQPVLVTLAPGQEIVPVASDPQPIDELAVENLSFGFTRQTITAILFDDVDADGTRFGPGPDTVLGTADDVLDPDLPVIGRVVLEVSDGVGGFTQVADTGFTVGPGVPVVFDDLLPNTYRLTAFANDASRNASSPQPVLINLGEGQQFVPIASQPSPLGEVAEATLAFGFTQQVINNVDLQLIGDTFDSRPDRNQTYIDSYTVTNLSAIAATNVVTTITLPAGVTFDSGSVTGGTVTSNGNQITATIPTLAASSSAFIDLTLLVGNGVAAGLTLTSNATVTADQNDLIPGNNVATSTETVRNIHRLSTGNGDGDVIIDVDAFGTFGEGLFGTSSFDPIGPVQRAEAVFRSVLALRESGTGPRTFLDTAPQGQADPITGDITTATSTFTIGSFDVQLVQTVSPSFDTTGNRNGARLDQTYTFTNNSGQAVPLDVVRYQDSDLLFDGSLTDGGGLLFDANGNLVLFETDAGGNGSSDATFVGITDGGGTAPPTDRFMIDDFFVLQQQVGAGTPLGDSVVGDNDADNFIDPGSEYDVSLALRRIFNIGAGQSADYTNTILFGASPAAIVPAQNTNLTITGNVACDFNNDGAATPVANARVFLDADGDRIHDDPDEASTFTDNQGNYSFANVTDSSLTVVAEVPNGCTTIPASPGVARQDVEAGNLARAIDSVDLNGDGFRDLVVASDLSGTLTVLINEGGQFPQAQTQNVPLGERPQSVFVFEQPGSLPMIVSAGIGTPTSGGTVYQIDSGLGVSTVDVGNGPIEAVLNDFDNNGVADLVTASIRSSDLRLMLNGAGEASVIASARLVRAVETGDINNDGNADIALAGYGYPDDPTSELRVLVGDGTGGFSEPISTNPIPRLVSLKIAELILDPIPSGTHLLALSELGQLTVYRLENDSLNQVSSINVGDGATSFDVGDFNHDGVTDVAVANLGSQEIDLFVGDGSGNFREFTSFTGVPAPSDIVVDDFDNDGRRDDIAVANTFQDANLGQPGAPQFVLPSSVTVLRTDVAESSLLISATTATTVNFSFASAAPALVFDVTGEGEVTALDALRVINFLASDSLNAESESGRSATDVNGDGQTSAVDALMVINYMARESLSPQTPINDEDREEDERVAAVDVVFQSLLF